MMMVIVIVMVMVMMIGRIKGLVSVSVFFCGSVIIMPPMLLNYRVVEAFISAICLLALLE